MIIMIYLIMIMKLSLGLVPMQFATFNWLSTHPSCHHVILVIGILDFFWLFFATVVAGCSWIEDNLLGFVLRQFWAGKIAQDRVNCVGDVTVAIFKVKIL